MSETEARERGWRRQPSWLLLVLLLALGLVMLTCSTFEDHGNTKVADLFDLNDAVSPPDGEDEPCEEGGCGAYESCCSGICVHTSGHDDHCGECGLVCPEGEKCCDGMCRDLQVDVDNCGSCGEECSENQDCCRGTCRDLKSDPSHCGACGRDCPENQACCEGVCRDLQSDQDHCGQCETPCTSQQGCILGECLSWSCDGDVCNDYELGLQWRTNSSGSMRFRDDLAGRCGTLDDASVTGWRVPTITELRSLVEGCTLADACGVNNQCLESSCWDHDCDARCVLNEGPRDGCYLADELEGPCGAYWSSDGVTGEEHLGWVQDFRDASIASFPNTVNAELRCVRVFRSSSD